MAGRATGELDCRPDLVFGGQLFADFFLICGGFPIHVENLVFRANVLRGITVAIEAPLHRQRRGLKNQRHLVDRAVARGAADSFVDVNAVVEIDIIGEAVNLDPLDRLIRSVALANRLEITDVIEENRMAIHAGFRRRNAGEGRSLDAGVAVAAIDPVIASVVLVAELQGLHARHTLVCNVGRTRNQQDARYGQSAERNGREQTKPRNKIYTAMKNLCHVSGAPESLLLRNGCESREIRPLLCRAARVRVRFRPDSF